MSAFMAFLMSGILVAVHSGVDPAFMGRWMPAFALAFTVAFPTVLVIAPFVTKLASLLVKPD